MTRARRGRGFVSSSSSAICRRLLLRRVESCKPNISPSDADSVFDRLRSRFSKYGRLKLQPFTRLVHDLLRNRPPRDAEGRSVGDEEETEDVTIRPSSRKHCGGGAENGDEKRLLVAEEEYLRRERKLRDFASSSVSSASDSGSSHASVEADAVFSAMVDPVCDVTMDMLREKYKNQTASIPASIDRSEGKEAVVMETENAVEKTKRRVLGLDGGRGVEETPAVPRGGGGDSMPLGKEIGTEPPRFKDFGGIKGVLEVIVPPLHPELPRELGVGPMVHGDLV